MKDISVADPESDADHKCLVPSDVSLDLSRRKPTAENGRKIFDEVIRLAGYGRDEINKLGGYYAYSKERTNGDTFRV